MQQVQKPAGKRGQLYWQITDRTNALLHLSACRAEPHKLLSPET